jgi:hypothetical protein
MEAMGKTASVQLYDMRVQRIGEAVNMLFLGQTLSSRPTANGTQALGAVQQSVRWDIVDDDAKQLAETWNSQFIRVYVAVNHGEKALAIAPTLAWDLRAPQDVLERGNTIERALRIGMAVPRKWAYETLQIPEPTDDEDVLDGIPQAAGLGLNPGGNFGAGKMPAPQDGAGGTDALQAGDDGEMEATDESAVAMSENATMTKRAGKMPAPQQSGAGNQSRARTQAVSANSRAYLALDHWENAAVARGVAWADARQEIVRRVIAEGGLAQAMPKLRSAFARARSTQPDPFGLAKTMAAAGALGVATEREVSAIQPKTKTPNPNAAANAIAELPTGQPAKPGVPTGAGGTPALQPDAGGAGPLPDGRGSDRSAERVK